MAAPTDSYGFGEVKPPAPEWVLPGRIAWDEHQGETGNLEFETIELTGDGEIRLCGTVGDRTFEAHFPRPVKPTR